MRRKHRRQLPRSAGWWPGDQGTLTNAGQAGVMIIEGRAKEPSGRGEVEIATPPGKTPGQLTGRRTR
jgi:hypothetical protein